MTNAHGADFSLWNDNNSTAQSVNFDQAKAAGLSFAFIKASQAQFADPDFITNWANAKGKVYRGAYHFLTWNDGAAQADYFWSLLERNGAGELPLICDFEWWSTTPVRALDYLYAFLERLKIWTGKPKGIYTAASFWRQYGSTDSYWDQYWLWLCDITGPVEVPAPWKEWDFHQYTFKLDGPAYGAESLDLDGNWYNGTVEQMQAAFGLPPLEQPTSAFRVRAGYSVNVRSMPSVYAPVVGKLAGGQIVTALEWHQQDKYIWLRHAAGWSAVSADSAWFMEVV